MTQVDQIQVMHFETITGFGSPGANHYTHHKELKNYTVEHKCVNIQVDFSQWMFFYSSLGLVHLDNAQNFYRDLIFLQFAVYSGQLQKITSDIVTEFFDSLNNDMVRYINGTYSLDSVEIVHEYIKHDQIQHSSNLFVNQQRDSRRQRIQDGRYSVVCYISKLSLQHR